MKKVWGFVMAGICALALTGCGGAPADKAAAPAEAPAQVLKVGTEPNYPPFETYQKETKTYSGYDIELVRAVAQNMGYKDIEIVDTTMTDIYKDLDAKKFDVAAAALSVTDNRKAIVDFSDPYLMSRYTVIVAKNYEGATGKEMLTGKKVAVEKGTSFADALKDLKCGEILEERSALNAILAVTDGTADAAVMDTPDAAFYIANGYGDKITAHAGPFEGQDVPIAFAVRKGDADFLKKLNTALSEFKRTTNAKQMEKSYFGEELSKI